MRLISWIFRIFLFLIALGFAVSNTEITKLNFFGMSTPWSAPLVLFLLVFFAAGTIVGLLAVVPMVYRYRREIGRLRKELKLNAQTPPVVGPSPDVPTPAGSTLDPSSPAHLGL